MFSKLVIAKKKKIKIILTKDTLIGWFTNNKLIPYCNKICIIVYESDLCMIKPIIQDLYEKYSKHDIYICVSVAYENLEIVPIIFDNKKVYVPIDYENIWIDLLRFRIGRNRIH